MKNTLLVIVLMSLLVSLGAREKNVYILLHGLYSSNYHWKDLLESEEFAKSKFTYGGNFYVSESIFTSNKFVVTPELKDDFRKLLTKDNYVYTINFASGFQNDFQQQGIQIKEVLELFPADDTNYYLVGHSMGGLAARCFIASNLNRNIKGLITIGTPNLGSYLGNTSTSLTSFIGVITSLVKRPDDLITGISRIWKEKKKNVTPSLAPGSEELHILNQHTFPSSIKAVCIFSTINTPQEIDDLSPDQQFVHQVLQMEKLKSFRSTNPTDLEIATLYNDLYYNDGLVSIASQNINNAIPNRYQIEVHHIPTRAYHDNEPKDVNHLLQAMRIIQGHKRHKKYNLFIYSTTQDIIKEDYFESISKSFFNTDNYDATMVVEQNDSLKVTSLSNYLPIYDYGIFLINDTQKLLEVQSKIDSSWIKPIIVDFSINNNINLFEDKDCIYIKIVSVKEAENFFNFLGDILSGKVHVKQDELEEVREQIIRYYFTTSNMTDRLKIPDQWWKDNLRFFQ